MPELCSDGHVVAVGGKVAGGSQIVGMSVSLMIAASWLALNSAP